MNVGTCCGRACLTLTVQKILRHEPYIISCLVSQSCKSEHEVYPELRAIVGNFLARGAPVDVFSRTPPYVPVSALLALSCFHGITRCFLCPY